ncbi:uncharacterized protein EDB93DRAFT_557518 [Suillus bovinus]|uniref:uncharacterized protein n=1 Tax=Suillus bovinus TaxID=48563 RepID=UPI001B883DBE|nr:uncharacterized protein EDB93DRAFT_557518 [Suillus bovinus]KAG2158654.1 hypothetical protein EDB93DRAFT_557518 [Suillus bovinus]
MSSFQDSSCIFSVTSTILNLLIVVSRRRSFIVLCSLCIVLDVFFALYHSGVCLSPFSSNIALLKQACVLHGLEFKHLIQWSSYEISCCNIYFMASGLWTQKTLAAT